MKETDALKAMSEAKEVKLSMPGRPPYIGRLFRKIEEDSFWFEGSSGSERFFGRIKPEEVSFA